MVASIICALICLWAIKDGWFPSPSVEKKYPRRAEVSFDQAGIVAEVYVTPDEKVAEGSPLVKMTTHFFNQQLKSINSQLALLESGIVKTRIEYERLLRNNDDARERRRQPILKQKLEESQARRDRLLLDREKIREEIHRQILCAPLKGRVAEVLVKRMDVVEQDQLALVLHPITGFYLFNKVLAIGMFIGALVFLALYWKYCFVL